MSLGTGEAQVYLGGVDDQFECHLASVKPKCVWVGLITSLSAFGIGEAQVYLGGVDDEFECHLASVKPRCIWVELTMSLNVIWHRQSPGVRGWGAGLMLSLSVIWHR